MNKINFKIILLSFIILVLPTGCNGKYIKKTRDKPCYGIIKTTSQENKSFILFYDNNLQEVGREKIKYGSMGDGFSLPIIYDKSMYIVPKGIGTSKELTFIMEYNLNTGNIVKYNTGLQNMNSITITQDFVYGVNTLNFNSNIVKCNKNTRELLTKTIEKTYINYMEVYRGKLYAFARVGENTGMKNYLYVFDANNLDLLNKIDITSIGIGQESTLMQKNKLFFTTLYEIGDYEDQPSNKLSILNIESYQIKSYELREKYPYQIIDFNDKLLITHFDPVTRIGNKISILDLQTYDSNIIELEHNIQQIEKSDDTFIILGDEKLFIYDRNFKLIDSINIDMGNEPIYYYITGFFKI